MGEMLNIRIQVVDLTEHCSTYEQGVPILEKISDGLDQGANVEVSFTGIESVSSSFINAVLVELIDRYGLERVKERVKLTSMRKFVREMIQHQIFTSQNKNLRRAVGVSYTHGIKLVDLAKERE